jgi:hypothetical protein
LKSTRMKMRLLFRDRSRIDSFDMASTLRSLQRPAVSIQRVMILLNAEC